MSHDRSPASVGALGGAGSDDLAAVRVSSPYRPLQSKRKASLFEQLVALAHRTRIALKYEHAYGPDAPAGRTWWSPIDEGPAHYVRARRRGRS